MASHANPVNWFEIPVTDMDRARKFYETVLEIEIPEHEMNGTPMAWFPMEMDRMGATGALIKQETYIPSHEGSMVYINVDNIAATLEAIDANGGKTLNPRTSIGQHGWVAHFEDTEGNRVALHENAAQPEG